MHRIHPQEAFTLYALCTVHYEGRAASYLELGNYLIVHKPDGSLIIHGSTLCNPINYQGSKSTLAVSGNSLISTRKKETITINITTIWSYSEIINWTEGKLKVSRTEHQLRDKIAADLEPLLGTKITTVTTEAVTDVGNADILANGADNTFHVIEVKRGKANLAAGSQLKRYVEYYQKIRAKVIGYVASPDISANALKYLQNNQFQWLKVSH